ncbi:response regulator [Mongoliitalea daihaiensis]|uniref:response regulator n=1 Tax=Mongoliitalea daihaiensis TaxID=2782006 RepID=UPI001F2D9596|nr:response regulator [Mongoliitalea daihaiensis]UJP65215.1 response regulator [Mongoliitalea daihaiensis]
MLIHIIDDSKGYLALLTELITEIDPTIVITTSSNGQEALEHLSTCRNRDRSEYPHGILLDLNMPVMNGIEFLDRIKTWEEFIDIPIIVLTTSSDSIDIQKSYKNNCTAFFTKPEDAYETSEMLQLITEFIEIHWKKIKP